MQSPSGSVGHAQILFNMCHHAMPSFPVNVNIESSPDPTAPETSSMIVIRLRQQCTIYFHQCFPHRHALSS